jgi:integrase
MARAESAAWSYSAGRRGGNRVRAFFDPRDGAYYLEWRESGRRCRQKLGDVTSQEAAADKADTLAGKFAEADAGEIAAPMTLDRLLRLYLAERTPQKGMDRQRHDQRAAGLWRSFLGRQRLGLRPEQLTRKEWDGYLHARRTGTLGRKPAKNNTIRMDLKFMIAVLGWGVGTGRMVRHPWNAEIRRTQGWMMPKERTPHRPAMTDELRQGLIAHAPGWQFAAALELERETRRRNSAIRRLRWSDMDLTAGTVLWRGEFDKAGREGSTPLPRRAVEILRNVPRGIGDVPVFPSETDTSEGTPRNTWQRWLSRAKERWLRSIEDPEEQVRLREALRGIGYHSEKRAGVRDPRFRQLSRTEQEELAGTSWDVLSTVYDDLTEEDLRDAIRRLETG